jgi:hypothetical protein
MTRTRKDAPHKNSDAELTLNEHVPKYFGKASFVDQDPKKVKKNGGGKGNWYEMSFPFSAPRFFAYIYTLIVPLMVFVAVVMHTMYFPTLHYTTLLALHGEIHA